MALSLAELGEHDRALALLERLTATHSHLAELHYDKGRLLGAMGRYDDEIAAYKSAIAIEPRLTVAHINLGVVLRDLHRFDEALLQFARAIEIDPNSAGAHGNRAQTNLLLGDFDPGWREYEWRWLDGGQPSHGFDQARLWTGEQPIPAKRSWPILSRASATRCSLSATSIYWSRPARESSCGRRMHCCRCCTTIAV